MNVRRAADVVQQRPLGTIGAVAVSVAALASAQTVSSDSDFPGAKTRAFLITAVATMALVVSGKIANQLIHRFDPYMPASWQRCRLGVDPQLNPTHFEICAGFQEIPDPPGEATLRELGRIANKYAEKTYREWRNNPRRGFLDRYKPPFKIELIQELVNRIQRQEHFQAVPEDEGDRGIWYAGLEKVLGNIIAYLQSEERSDEIPPPVEELPEEKSKGLGKKLKDLIWKKEAQKEKEAQQAERARRQEEIRRRKEEREQRVICARNAQSNILTILSNLTEMVSWCGSRWKSHSLKILQGILGRGDVSLEEQTEKFVTTFRENIIEDLSKKRDEQNKEYVDPHLLNEVTFRVHPHVRIPGGNTAYRDAWIHAHPDHFPKAFFRRYRKEAIVTFFDELINGIKANGQKTDVQISRDEMLPWFRNAIQKATGNDDVDFIVNQMDQHILENRLVGGHLLPCVKKEAIAYYLYKIGVLQQKKWGSAEKEFLGPHFGREVS